MESVDEHTTVPAIIDLDILHNAAVGFMRALESGRPVTYGTGDTVDDKYATYVGKKTIVVTHLSNEAFDELGQDLGDHFNEPGAHYFVNYVSVNVSRDGFIIEATFYKKR